ncbi:hypothetical protein N7517_010118 [Penicillium concentricum]|uniref:Uncharacterized protein n=1 Tax=Penicillium concentricum TaxID=293559 RepID=A0A9W9UXE1_9EURO|nr:uncharacterized protein N7517_010118 [Penicillium concentricum]KAJ5360927.1 hypothetical protein N7517_010118 [Penicillium concentricum]
MAPTSLRLTGYVWAIEMGFIQQPGQVLGAVLEAQSRNLYFGDFMCQGSRYAKNFHMEGLQDVAGTSIKPVGELKVPWVPEHDIQKAARHTNELKREITQRLRDMQCLGCHYGFLSTYNQTILLKSLSPGGSWEVWYSRPIFLATSYTLINPI